MKKRSSIALLTALLAIVFAAGIGVYSNYIGMQIYEESSNHLLESYAQISKTFTLFVQRNWVVLSQWDSLMKNAQEDADIDSIWSDAQNNKLLWHYSDFYLFNESTQYLTVDGRKGSADSINGVFSGDVQQGRANRLHLYGNLRRAEDRVCDADEPQSDAGRRDLHRYRGQL